MSTISSRAVGQTLQQTNVICPFRKLRTRCVTKKKDDMPLQQEVSRSKLQIAGLDLPDTTENYTKRTSESKLMPGIPSSTTRRVNQKRYSNIKSKKEPAFPIQLLHKNTQDKTQA
ncbi:hypothetical protein M758_5G146200 [Ceratodon purpureus]|nr:hypothetical protein M758_5G146200 [Ceratodon purpureus]